MKNKKLFIILIILVLILSAILIFTNIRIKSKDEKNTSRDFILNGNVSSTVNTHGENAGIYVGTTEKGNDNYLFISIYIDKKASKEDQIKSLISSISTATGYKIDINSVKIDNDDIKIDLAKTAAPFELQDSYEYTDNQKYFIATDYAIEKTLLDSINKTLKSYFGEDTKVYLSSDSENIHIENRILTIDIDSTKSYDEQ